MIIELTQGQTTIVDDIDGDLARYSWYAWYAKGTEGYYARRTIRLDIGKRGELLHRVILGRKLGRVLMPYEKVDHVHGLTLDNRRDELRLATNQQNGRNRGKQLNNTSGYKGVSYHIRRNSWQANIDNGEKLLYLGLHDTAEDAAIAYDVAAIELFGEYAVLNFPQRKEQF